MSWRDPRLAVGVGLVAGSALLGVALFGGSEDTVGVWASPAPLAEGQRLAAADLERYEVGFSDAEAAQRYLPADQEVPEGQVVTRAVGAGELVPRAALSPQADSRWLEVPLSVPTGAVPATVGMGARVDVWVTPELTSTPGAGGSKAALVLDDVRVVGLPRSGGLGAGGDRQVVVALAEERAEVLPAALAGLARGTVVLVRTP